MRNFHMVANLPFNMLEKTSMLGCQLSQYRGFGKVRQRRLMPSPERLRIYAMKRARRQVAARSPTHTPPYAPPAQTAAAFPSRSLVWWLPLILEKLRGAGVEGHRLTSAALTTGFQGTPLPTPQASMKNLAALPLPTD